MLQNVVTDAEIQRAIKQARALFVYGAENITNQGFWLGYSEMFADLFLVHRIPGQAVTGTAGRHAAGCP